MAGAGFEPPSETSGETQFESPGDVQYNAQQGETDILTDAESLTDDPRLRDVLASARDLLSALNALELDCPGDAVKGVLYHVHDAVELLHKLATEAPDGEGRR